MPADGNSPDAVRKQIEQERESLAEAVTSLRTELKDATDISSKLPPMPALAAGALLGGFVLSGGIGATMRLIFRRGRGAHTRVAAGRFRLVDDE